MSNIVERASFVNTTAAPASAAAVMSSPGAGAKSKPNGNAASDPITGIRLRLHNARYFPIPVVGKKPVLKGWEKQTGTTPQDIAAWSNDYPSATNTGVLTAPMPTLDVDILDPEAAAAVETLVRDRFGDCGRFLVRFGRPPKRAIPFQTAKPFPKILRMLVGPDGNADQRIELLCDGQQLAVDGIHPETKKPYTWFGGELGDVRLDELPCINEAEAEQLLRDAVDLLVSEHGYVIKADDSDVRRKNGNANPGHPLALRLACKLWGEPTSQAGDEYRFGAHGSKSLDTRTGVWFDFENNNGGGERDLIRVVNAASSAKSPEAQRLSAQLILTSANFIADFTPPDYLIKGLIQRRFVYSMTAPTGAGKTCVAMRLAAHVAFGLPLAGRQIKEGRVLFMAGENPDDVRMRWIKLSEEMQIDPASDRIFWCAGSHDLSNKELQQNIRTQIADLGQIALVVVDTSAAFFKGDDENSNAQLGNHARNLRSLVDLPGGPAVIVTCHPTKNPDMDNLVPRGGGAFLAEVDGNLCVVKSVGGAVVDLHWHGKFRGPDFAPIPFKITPGRTGSLKDSDGDMIWTVTATPISEAEQTAAENTAHSRQDELMAAMQNRPGSSLSELAREAGWLDAAGEPNKSLVQRTLTGLKADGLAEKKRGRWVLTKAAGKGPRGRSFRDSELPF